MAGAEAQAGFYYQNLVAALYALDLIEFGSRLRCLTLENPERAKHIDDIIVDFADASQFVQVKWSENESSALTLSNLVVAEEESTSLIAKLARGFRQVSTEDGSKEIILFSTRKAGINRQPGSGFDKSLSQFITDFHQPFVCDPLMTHIQQAPAFAEYEAILDRLLTASGLRDRGELSLFLKCLQFRLNQPDRDALVDRVRGRLERLGIEQRQYATLLDNIVNWSISGYEVHAEDVLRVLGLRDRFIEHLNHHYPVDSKVWVATPELFSLLDASIGALDSGFVLLEGEPGSGKSTAVTKYLSEHPMVSFGYYCFIPNDRTIGNERLGDDAFVRSICIGLRNAFPDVEFPKPYAVHTRGLLNEWLAALSASGRRIVFVVDGVDHVDRKSRQSLVAQPLTSVLDGELPPNVLIVLSSRYPEALPPSVLQHIQKDPRRRIQMPRFGRNQVSEFLRLRGVGLANELLDAATNVSGGVPIYLEYLASRLEGMTSFEQEQYLKSVPTLRDKKIDDFHQHLWEQCTGDDRLIYMLAILAVRDEFTTPGTLVDLMRLVGVNLSLAGVHETLVKILHVLRVSDAKSVAIRHSSLAEFVLERTAHLRKQITHAILKWYEEQPTSDDAWRHQFRHLFEAGEFSAVLVACNDSWLKRAWVCHRPLGEIQRNLNIAWHAGSVIRDLLQFIRVGLLKQQAALIDCNLDSSETKVAELLLDMGLTNVALGRIWDGERRMCGSVRFAEFSLRHVARTGRLLPEHILSAGLGDGPGPGADAEASRTWYRARSHSGDPLRLMTRIAAIHWRNKAPHGHTIDPADAEDNVRLNVSLQLAVIRELADRADINGLERIRGCNTLSAELMTAASAAAAVVLGRAGEASEATKILQEIDLTGVPTDYRRWVVLQVASEGLDRFVACGTLEPPILPIDLVSSEHKFNSRFFDLYDELRFFFLKNTTAAPWFDATTTGMAQPARTLVVAIGHLAKLWTHAVRGHFLASSSLNQFKAIVEGLDPDRRLFSDNEGGWSYANYVFSRSAHLLYEQVWSCAAEILSEESLLELVRWWVRTGDGNRALRYSEATQALAVAVHKRVPASPSDDLRSLLSLAERSKRSDEETSVLLAGLAECAAAWGRCGFLEEAQRLWEELLNIGCGVYSRKDYQFSEILTPLRLAHIQDPGATLKRVEEQLLLAHQLEGTGAPKMVAVAIEDLIEFISSFSPGLALEALVREEPLVFRERAIRHMVLSLLDNGGVDRRLLLSLVATMGRWENYRHFDDETKPAMFAVYAAALAAKDYETAGKVYKFARYVLLVEKEMPSELSRWAKEWVLLGTEPADVRADHAPQSHSTSEVPGESDRGSTTDARLTLELDELATGEISTFEERLDAIAQEEVRVSRLREVERAHNDWRTAFKRAVGRAWSEVEEKILQECWDSFAEDVAERLSLPGVEARKAIQELISQLTVTMSRRLSFRIAIEKVRELFDIEGWLDGLVHPSRSAYVLQSELRARLPTWIANAPLAKVEAWEDFCRRRCSDDTKAVGLLAVAERLAATRPAYAVEILFQARECVADFFFEHSNLAKHICAMGLKLDRDRGLELLFESFRHQYQRFPETIIYRVDTLLELAGTSAPFDAVELYNICADHNRRLAAGLSQKSVDLGWLHRQAQDDFAGDCVRYLVALFDYPVIDVRLLALDELVGLLKEREQLIETVLQLWTNCSDGQKEHIASLFHSLSFVKPDCAARWAPRLVELGAHDAHYNVRSTIAAAVVSASDACAPIDPKTMEHARTMGTAPRILVAQPLGILATPSRAVRLPPYLGWVLERLADIAEPDLLEARMLGHLRQLFSDPDGGMDNEGAVHRQYNINTNFDVIEIGGEFDQAVRAALNRAVQSLLVSHDVDHDSLERNEDLLRLRDPTDTSVRRVSRPSQIAWLNDELSDDEFTKFADTAKLQATYGARDGEWVTLFESTEQRSRERTGSEPQRASKARVLVFGVAPGNATPSLDEALLDARTGALALRRNLYRSELARTNVRHSSTKIMPLTIATSRAFRGRHAPDMAAIANQLLQHLSPMRDFHDPLGYLLNGEAIVRSVEWQEAFDQDRRRHEPRSAGFLLQITRQTLQRLGEKRGVEFWAYLDEKRTTDRYKEEFKMKWHRHFALFPLTLT